MNSHLLAMKLSTSQWIVFNLLGWLKPVFKKDSTKSESNVNAPAKLVDIGETILNLQKHHVSVKSSSTSRLRQKQSCSRPIPVGSYLCRSVSHRRESFKYLELDSEWRKVTQNEQRQPCAACGRSIAIARL